MWQREPVLAGRVGGGLYLGAGAYALLLLALPGTAPTHRALVVALASVVVVGRSLPMALWEEHAAMRELATAVAAGAPPADVCVLASRRVATLLGVDGCGIVEFAGPGKAVVSGAWANGAAGSAL